MIDDPATCHHEAGHAVVAFLVGGEVQSLALAGYLDDDDEPNVGRRFGECRVAWPSPGSSSMPSSWHPSDHRYREMMTLLGGPVAEQLYDDDDDAKLASLDDVRRAGRLAIAICGNATAADKLLRQIIAVVRGWLNQDRAWAAVAALADELDAHGEIDAEQAAAVLEFWFSPAT